MKKKRSERFLESADSKEGAGRNASLCHWSGKAELRQTGAVPASCLRFQLPTPPPPSFPFPLRTATLFELG